MKGIARIAFLAASLSLAATTAVSREVLVNTPKEFKQALNTLQPGDVDLTERSLQVGDRVAFDGQYGDITAIGLRSVRMQTSLYGIPRQQRRYPRKLISRRSTTTSSRE